MERVETTGTFGGVLGNGPVLSLLESVLERGEAAHAYLFYGPLGVGKRTVAYRFGAELVSVGDEGARDRALRGLHPDLDEVEPEGQFTTIGQVREVVQGAASRPFEGARRVFILRADTLNVQAANALLKTLEEEEARLAAALGRGSVGLALRYAEEDELRELREAVFGAGFAFGGSFEERYGAVEGIVARAEEVGAAREREYLVAHDENDGGPDRRTREAAKRLGRAARDGGGGGAPGLPGRPY